jgi:hypothetical protein
MKNLSLVWHATFAAFLLLNLIFGICVGPLVGRLGTRGLVIFGARREISWENIPKKVLAFYYGWYGNPKVSGSWFHWSDVDEVNKQIGSSAHYPLLGPYDSHDSHVIEQHFSWAKEAGIDGFIVSWWHPGDFHDQAMPLLLSTAQKFGLEISAYIETVQTKEQALDYLTYLLKHYGEHPSWLKIGGKPVLFIYRRAIDEIWLDGWHWVIEETNRRFENGAVFIADLIEYPLLPFKFPILEKAALRQATQIFDGAHAYNITHLTRGKSVEEIKSEMQKIFAEWVSTIGRSRVSCLTVIPGYDDSKLPDRTPPRPVTDRYDGRTYQVLWEAAIAANPDWILITSWNEWHEGTEIEPSLEHGNRELMTTAMYARRFKSGF